MKRTIQDTLDGHVLREYVAKLTPKQRAAWLCDNPSFTSVAGDTTPDAIIVEALRRYPVTYAGTDELNRIAPSLAQDVNHAARIAWIQAQVHARHMRRISVEQRAMVHTWSRTEAVLTVLATQGTASVGALAALYYITGSANALFVAPIALIYVTLRCIGAAIDRSPV